MTDPGAESLTLVWFTEDLRCSDNPALHAAAERGRVLAVYVDDPARHGDWPPGPASRAWLHHSLHALTGELAALGIELAVRRGDSATELSRLAEQTRADRLHCAQPLEPAARRALAAIEGALDERGIRLQTFGHRLLHDPDTLRNRAGGHWRVFTPMWKSLRSTLEASPPRPLPLPAPQADPVDPAPSREAIDALALRPASGWDRGFDAAGQAGSANAQLALEGFVERTLSGYGNGRDFPARGRVSGLSPHLHFGEVSPAQVWHAVMQAQHSGEGSGDDAWKFLSELAWREFAHHVLWHRPECPTTPLNPRFEQFAWREPEHEPAAAADLLAWQRGRTGVALVDAGMRELWATGRMHNRVRMVAASFLCKNLRLHWLHGARWFWHTLVDADLANNTMGWQWCAGCGADAAPFFRIFNPDTQAERFDPDGRYRARWRAADPVSEAIVDLKRSRQQALEAYRNLPSA